MVWPFAMAFEDSHKRQLSRRIFGVAHTRRRHLVFAPSKNTMAWCKLKLSNPEHTQELVSKENGADLKRSGGALRKKYVAKREKKGPWV